MKDILFLPLDIPYLTLDYDKLVTVAKTLDTISDEYRNCEHIPIRWTRSVNNSYNKLQWTDIAENQFPEVIEYAEQHLKPFVGEIPRIMIITTPPNTEGFDHIDCSPKSFDDVQLKFRSVLHGKTSTLYFLNEQGEREYAPEIGQQPFLMDGGWPHGLDNFTNKYKFTLAIGAGGVSLTDRLKHKIINLVIITANNQTNNVYQLKKLNLVDFAGLAKNISKKQLYLKINNFLYNYENQNYIYSNLKMIKFGTKNSNLLKILKKF